MGLQNLVILYGNGGLSDVGRHAILVAALEKKDVIGHVTVLTKYPELLYNTGKNPNWNCGCSPTTPQHTIDDEVKNQRLTIIELEKDKPWEDIDLSTYLTTDGKTTTKIISCLGNRQPFFEHWDSYDGNNALIRAIRAIEKITTAANKSATDENFRVVVITSCGINEDWPPFEFSIVFKIIMMTMFTIFARTPYNDLRTMELSYREKSNGKIDYLFVRALGLTEDIVPSHQWLLQREKYKHPLGIEIAKMDVARYMVEEVLQPTLHCTSVVIGSDPNTKLERVKL